MKGSANIFHSLLKNFDLEDISAIFELDTEEAPLCYLSSYQSSALN